jgi:hypothetical protein
MKHSPVLYLSLVDEDADTAASSQKLTFLTIKTSIAVGIALIRFEDVVALKALAFLVEKGCRNNRKGDIEQSEYRAEYGIINVEWAMVDIGRCYRSRLMDQ